MKPVDINEVSDFIIFYCYNEQININPIKLQKILYYVQAWHLVFFDKHPLFYEEPMAWVNGPVYREIYNKYKKDWQRHENISIKKGINIEEEMNKILNNLELDDEQVKFLFAVLQKYATMTSGQLVYLTHAEDPWNEAREGLQPFERSENTISFDSMYNYYSSKRKQ